MARVNWDGRGRVTRLSASAVELLTHLCVPDARLRFDPSGGTFWLCIGALKFRTVTNRTVDALAAPRLVTRVASVTVPEYVISDKGRDAMRARAQARCAEDGRECPGCTIRECPFNDGR